MDKTIQYLGLPEGSEVEKVHISEIQVGDMIIHHGQLKTLSRKFINRCPFMGISIWGDTYHLGRKPVIRIKTVGESNVKK